MLHPLDAVLDAFARRIDADMAALRTTVDDLHRKVAADLPPFDVRRPGKRQVDRLSPRVPVAEVPVFRSEEPL